MTNNHNLFPLPYWAPALRRVPVPLKLLDEAYQRGTTRPDGALEDAFAAEPKQNLTRAFLSSSLPRRGR